MKRPLSVLTAAVLLGGGVVLPVTAAHAADSDDFTVSGVQTSWVDDTVTVRYSWDSTAEDSSIDVLVDGVSVKHTPADAYGDGAVTARVSRSASAGPAAVSVVAHVCAYTDDYSSIECADTTRWSGTVRRLRTPPAGSSSATALLNALVVRGESHAGSYQRSKFPLWVDANGDGENTRVEVLKAESSRRVAVSAAGTVKTGKWTSPYDGKQITVGSKLDIDHTVPLAEAWVSGAATWSTKKRTAYANDLGYGASLVAVTKHANRSKGDKDSAGYLPAAKSYRCAYVRNWIGVKSRWHLAVNPAEKTALAAALVQYCSLDWVKTPAAPKIAALVPKPAPKKKHTASTGSSSSSTGSSSGGSSSAYYANCSAVRAAGKAPLYAGQPGYETPRLDRDGDGVACE